MPKRRPPLPDTRPDWRDPNMPVIRNYRMGDGSRKIEVDPDYEHRYSQHRLETGIAPHYTNDPTYNLRRTK